MLFLTKNRLQAINLTIAKLNWEVVKTLKNGTPRKLNAWTF